MQKIKEKNDGLINRYGLQRELRMYLDVEQFMSKPCLIVYYDKERLIELSLSDILLSIENQYLLKLSDQYITYFELESFI